MATNSDWVEVVLTPKELQHARNEGTNRRIRCMALGIPNKNGNNPKADDFERDVCGAIGELAVAKYFNLHWTGQASKKNLDVGNLIEVRTVRKPNHRIWLYGEGTRYSPDPDGVPFVLAYYPCTGFSVYLKGWTTFQDARLFTGESDPSGQNRSAYYLEDEHLFTIGDLYESVPYLSGRSPVHQQNQEGSKINTRGEA